MLYIMDAELIEGNYVLYQGDLSTIELEKLKRGQEQAPLDSGLALRNK